LCFHGVGTCHKEREPGEGRYWVTEELFRRVLDHVVEEGDVELSFDDGNASDIEVVLPALQARGLKATHFVLAGRLGDPGSLAPDDLRELHNLGMHIGNHGWAHVPWRGLTPDEKEREFYYARKALEEASDALVTTAALPLGRYDRQCLRALKRAGYHAVYTSDRFPAQPKSWLQARYSVTAYDTLESIMGIVQGRSARWDMRNRVASTVKRLR
jgi:peptidoglycan/xylan/chitin deacetylase (PgdA/CDA1 family)